MDFIADCLKGRGKQELHSRLVSKCGNQSAFLCPDISKEQMTIYNSMFTVKNKKTVFCE